MGIFVAIDPCLYRGSEQNQLCLDGNFVYIITKRTILRLYVPK